MCYVQSVVDEVGRIKETILDLESYQFYDRCSLLLLSLGKSKNNNYLQFSVS